MNSDVMDCWHVIRTGTAVLHTRIYISMEMDTCNDTVTIKWYKKREGVKYHPQSQQDDHDHSFPLVIVR